MVYQISVFLENRAGQFAEITAVLAENGVDLRAISIAETADYGILRMIVDNAEKATSILMQHGYLLSMTPVLVVAVPDQPGGIATILSTLPEQLQYTAQLRIDNPELSISELAAVHQPQITKSCLNHRLRKLTEMASKI